MQSLISAIVNRFKQAGAQNRTPEKSEYEVALASYDRALVLKPDDAEALNKRGNALLKLNRPADALSSYDRALLIKPDYPAAHYNRGNALLELKRPEEALFSFDRALAFEPNDAEALTVRGNALLDLKRPHEALASYDRALALEPDYVTALYNRGNVLLELKRHEDAIASYDRALALDPDFAEALSNRGDALLELDRAGDALASYDRALALEPDFVGALSNRGNALRQLQRFEEAVASYGRALALDPGHVSAHQNESLCRLLMGDVEAGWRKYEWRWRDEHLENDRRDFTQPLWLGERALAGKTVLLHAEQGLGDTIQFCRYAKLVAQQGATVLLEVPSPLESLLGHLEGVSQLLVKGEPLPAFDYHCPLLSLPLAFNTGLETIPAEIPYLYSDPVRVGRWRAKLGAKPLPRVGLAWSGSAAHKNDHNRSIPLAELARLVSGQAQFVSLQKELRKADELTLDQRREIRHLGDGLTEFPDTAALIALMDLIITVDTAVAHLAGAMGKPVWILLPFNPDWRWLLNRDDSPWYPTARLFRQPANGDWDSVIQRVASELQKRFGGSAN